MTPAVPGSLTYRSANDLLNLPLELICRFPPGKVWAWMLKEGGYGERGFGFYTCLVRTEFAMTRISMRLNGRPDVSAYDDSTSCNAFLSIEAFDPDLSLAFVMSLAEQEAFAKAILEAVHSAREKNGHHDLASCHTGTKRRWQQ